MNALSARTAMRSRLLCSLALLLGLCWLQACVVGGNVCTLDSDCYSPYPACVEGVCVECRQTKDCQGIGVCKANKCVAAPSEKKPVEPDEEPVTDGSEPTPEPDRDNGPELECKPGSKRSCYGGPKGTVSNGVCRAGEQLCTDEGKWGKCDGEVQPSAEICDGKDNNCDGKKDEGCVCIPGNSQDCGTDVGACKKGKQDCIDGGKKWGECKNGVEPDKETCDNKDNDCDGDVDEGCDCDPGKQRECGTDNGICQKGKQTCDPNGKWGECQGSIKPAAKDLCNGKDDDCDGKIDEDYPNIGKKCQEGKGACLREGVFECKSDGSSGCSRKAGSPSTELCNGKDDDCDGQTDEDWPNLGQSCTVSTGICKATGRIACNTAQTAAACDAKAGTPRTETCNGLDDDCDGKVDEDLKRPLCTRQSGVCAKSLKTCAGTQGWKDCSTSDYLKINSSYETSERTCDGKDNDCDGSVDETFAERGQSCKDSTKQGICANGTRVCISGKLGCQATQQPITEICGNSKDDDCDGLVDEKNGCSSVNTTLGIVDYAPMQNGGFFVLHPSSGTLRATCYSSSGTITQATFTIATANRFPRVMVQAAASASIVVVSWLNQATSSSSSTSVMSRVYDNNCKALTPAIAWPGGTERRAEFDVSVNPDGSFAGIYRVSDHPSLILFDKSGKSKAGAQLLDPQRSQCRNNGYGIHIATNTRGDGIVTCQRSSSTPIYYRRFKSTGVWVDTTPQELTLSRSNSASGDTHTVGYNNNGGFVIQWQSRVNNRDIAVFFDSSKRVVATRNPLGYRSGNSRSGLNGPNQKVRLWNGDFILRDSYYDVNRETRYYRYSAAGKLLAVGFSVLNNKTLRTRGTAIFLSDGRGIQANTIDLNTNKGLCRGGPCVCVPGEKRSCYSDNGTLRSSCKAGIITCNSTGTAWSTCVGEVLPTPEVCNGKDDDCDGRVDEDCKVTGQLSTAGADDIGVSTTNRLVTIRKTSNALIGQCYNVLSGPLNGTTFRISEYGRTARNPMVKVSRNGGVFLVTWLSVNEQSRAAGQLRSRLYNNKCQPITQPISWYTGELGLVYFDADVDNKGNFALLVRRPDDQYLLRLSVYDSTGRAIRTNLLVDASRKCPASPSYSFKVSLNPVSGGGVVSCQGFSNDPIYFRRFSSNATFVDSDVVEVTGSAKNNSAGSKTHATAMNGNGEFVVYWLNATTYQYIAAFYNSSATQTKRVSISDRLYRTSDSLSTVYDRVHLMKDDFVFYDADLRYSAPLSRFYRYNSKGVLLSSAMARSNDLRQFYRFYNDSSIGLSSTRNIVLNPLDLKPGANLCSGRPCLCKPSSTRSCYNGGHSARTPCKTGKQTCNSTGTAWGACAGEVIPKLEICGNKIDDDCDGQTDEECSVSTSIDLPGFTDYDVSSNGGVFSVHWSGTSLLGQCFKSDGKLVKGPILLVSQGQYVRYPTVHTSQNGSYTIVTWQQSVSTSFPYHVVYSRIFDSNCNPVSRTIRWPQGKTNDVRFDVAIDNAGNAYLAWRDNTRRLHLSMVDKAGNFLASRIAVEPTNTSYCKGTYQFQVAVNPLTGDGVITCQQFYTQPITYRLFRLRTKAMSNTGMTIFSQTQNRNSSYSASHLTMMNSKGVFVLLWQNYTQRTFQAAFYSTSFLTGATTKLLKNVTVGSNMIFNYDAFTRSSFDTLPRIAMNGDNFILRDGGRSGNTVVWYEYNTSGSVVRKATWKSTYNRNSFRMGGGKTFVIENNKLKVNELLLK